MLVSAITAAHQQLGPTDQLLVVVDHNDELRDRLVTEVPSITDGGAPVTVIDSAESGSHRGTRIQASFRRSGAPGALNSSG